MAAAVRPTFARLNSLGRYKYMDPGVAVDHVVVGAGVVGLAIASKLSRTFPDKSTVLVERHSRPGQETSSRNSEVIHAGLYYKPNSLKTILCLRGRTMLYDYCRRHSIPHQPTGKLVIAQENQLGHLVGVQKNVESLRSAAAKFKDPKAPNAFEEYMVPETSLISGDEARILEPDLSPDIAGALISSSTGIVDSHSLMQALETDILDSEGGDIAYSTKVVRVDPHSEGFVVQLSTGQGDVDSVLARTLVNSSGLSGNLILNSLRPNDPIPMYLARGAYVSYPRSRRGASRVTRLLYPVPDADAHTFASLGTHLTLDLNGNIRFGPDLEWISPPDTFREGEEDHWWESSLVPRELDHSARDTMYSAISKYLAGIEMDALQVEDYVGIRPKIIGPNAGFQDFVLRVDRPSDFGQRDARCGKMISLLGIESPGLTSSLALGDLVVSYVC